jgi:tetratricopeptide (TPR) repeat protein
VKCGNGLRPRFRGRTGFRLAAAWFLAPLLPVLGLLPFDFQYFSSVADHYLYLPMIGVALAVAVLVPATLRWKTAIPIGLIAAALCVLTVRQERTWMNTTALAGQAIAVNPRTFAGHDLLGYEHFVAGRNAPSPAAAQEQFDAAIAEYKLALSNNPEYAFSMTNLAHVEHGAGRSKEALQTLRRLIALQPSLPPRMRARPDDLARDLYAYGDPEGAARMLSNYRP